MNADIAVKKNGTPKQARSPKKSTDMTEGPLLGKIVRFSIPLILTGILSLLYNAADLIVVGNFAGSNALGAVSSTGSLNTLMINFFFGISTGAAVIASQHFGAKEDDKIRSVLHTSVLVGFFSGIFLLVMGLLFSKTFLIWMGTDPEVLEGAALYMKIIFLGVPGNLVYNYCASVLRASGDTKRPLIFLSIAGLVNVGMNLVLVIGFHLGVAGVAIATITSQYLSAIMILFYLSRQKGALRFSFRDLRFDWKQFKRILGVGIPCGIQGSLFAISNVMIQSSINSFGAVAVAGNGAGANIEGFVYTSMNALYQASMTFTGQNVGARKPERILRVLGACVLVVFLVWCVVGGVSIIFREPLVTLYVSENDANFHEVVRYGADRISIVGATYFLCGIMEVFVGCLRGMGKTIVPTIVSLLGACAFRVVWIFTIFQYYRTLECLYLSYPISWILTSAVQFTLCYFIQRNMKKQARKERELLHVAG